MKKTTKNNNVTTGEAVNSAYEKLLARKGRLPLQDLIVMYPDGTSFKLKSTKGGIVNVPVLKEQHQAWGMVKITKTTNVNSKYKGWISTGNQE